MKGNRSAALSSVISPREISSLDLARPRRVHLAPSDKMTWAVAAISPPWRSGGLTLEQGSDRCCRCGVVQAGHRAPALPCGGAVGSGLLLGHRQVSFLPSSKPIAAMWAGNGVCEFAQGYPAVLLLYIALIRPYCEHVMRG
jgi:hypothetical protein